MPGLGIRFDHNQLHFLEGPELTSLLTAYPRVHEWLQRLLAEVTVATAEAPAQGVWDSRNPAETITRADKFGKRWAELVNCGDLWDDAKALFQALTLMMLDSWGQEFHQVPGADHATPLLCPRPQGQPLGGRNEKREAGVPSPAS